MGAKICFKCNIDKPLNEYYVHKQMGDGHLNKCKSCTKNDTKKRVDELIKDPEWKKQEQKRHREKYYRLEYKEKHKPSKEEKKEIIKRYKEKYPEKYFAKSILGKHNKVDGQHRHHWSYNKEHWRDIIIVSEKIHNTIHRFMIYDEERMMYRTLDGILLDTKERHEKHIKYILELEE